MSQYKMREIEIIYRDVDLDVLDLMTINEAAGLLGMTIGGVSSLIDRGDLVEIVDESAPKNQGRRLLLRREVSARLLDRAPLGEVSGIAAASLLGVSKSRVSQLVKAGKLELSAEGLARYRDQTRGKEKVTA